MSYNKDGGSILFKLLSAPDNLDLSHLTSLAFQVCLEMIHCDLAV